jgi:hypothetical protein
MAPPLSCSSGAASSRHSDEGLGLSHIGGDLPKCRRKVTWEYSPHIAFELAEGGSSDDECANVCVAWGSPAGQQMGQRPPPIST